MYERGAKGQHHEAICCNRRWLGRTAAASLLLAGLITVSTGDASATFPGGNGLILGSRYNGTHWELYTVRSDGSGFRSLTPNNHNDGPDWSPDGKRIAFGGDVTGSNQVHIMKADGSGRRQLSHNLSYAAYPQWSPDGKWLTFAGSADPNLPGDVFIVRADGTRQRNLTNTPEWDEASEGAPWSPQGNRIAFESLRSGTADLYTMKPDGSDARQITRGAGDDRSPDWSPDGRALAYSHGLDTSEGQTGSIFTIPATGGRIRKITRNTTTGDASPTWSPDGKQILFRRIVKEPRNVTYDLFRIRLADQKVFRVTRTSATDGVTSWQRVPRH